MSRILLIVLFVTLNASATAFAQKPVDFNKLSQAIKQAENSKNHPYGVLKPYCTAKTEAQCLKGCLQTLHNRYRDYLKDKSTEDFISYLSQSYAPLNAKNDPTGLNKNWVKNVKYFYNRA